METQYVIETKTADIKDAGTDSGIYIQLIGEKGISSELKHDNKEDNHERGKIDIISNSNTRAENVGWLRQIRVRSDGKNDQPGWIVNYVKITDPSYKLTWRVDLNRSIDKNHGLEVTADVPVSFPELQEGVLKKIYLGVDITHQANLTGPSDLTFKHEFSHEYLKGVSVDLTQTKTIEGSISLGAKFFDLLDSKFSLSMTKSISKTLKSTEQTKNTWKNSIEYIIPKGEAITIACMYFQNMLLGVAHGDGVSFGYADHFNLNTSLFIFGGILTDDQVHEELAKYLIAEEKLKIHVLTLKETLKKGPVDLSQVSLAKVNAGAIEKQQKKLPVLPQTVKLTGTQKIP